MKPILQTLIVALLFLSTYPVSGQTRPAAIKEIKGIFYDAMKRIDSIRGKPAESDLAYLKSRIEDAVRTWKEPYEKGNKTDRNLVIYYRAAFCMRLGQVFLAAGHFEDAYFFYHDLPKDIEYLLGPNVFPIKYVLENKSFIISDSYIAEAAPIFYNEYAGLLVRSGKWEEMEYAGKSALKLKRFPPMKKYIVTTALIEAVKKRAVNKDSLASYLIENINSLAKLDSAEQRLILERHFPNYDFRYDELHELMGAVKKRSLIGSKAGTVYWEARDTLGSREFFNIALQAGGFIDKFDLQNAAEVTLALKDKELGLQVADKMIHYPMVEKECALLSAIAKIYRAFGSEAEAIGYEKKRKRCGSQADFIRGANSANPSHSH